MNLSNFGLRNQLTVSTSIACASVFAVLAVVVWSGVSLAARNGARPGALAPGTPTCQRSRPLVCESISTWTFRTSPKERTWILPRATAFKNSATACIW